MARDPQISEAEYQKLVQFAAGLGYDLAQIRKVPQQPRGQTSAKENACALPSSAPVSPEMSPPTTCSVSTDITVFEQNSHVGGHTHTHAIQAERDYAIDTGFIVFNDWTYPQFIALLEELGVASQPTEMSFSQT
ncbi:MAG: FAD-dependent oxidoreductase [Thiolinea sp.]